MQCGPHVPRLSKISFEACIDHYLRQAERTFANHPHFTLIMADAITRRRAASKTRLRMQGNFDKVITVQPAEFKQQLLRMQTLHLPRGATEPISEAAGALWHTISAGRALIHGTPEEARFHYKRIQSLRMRHGSAQLWMTVRPHPHLKVCAHHYCC